MITAAGDTPPDLLQVHEIRVGHRCIDVSAEVCALGGHVEHPRVAERLEVSEFTANLVGVVRRARPGAGHAHGVAEQVAIAETERIQ